VNLVLGWLDDEGAVVKEERTIADNVSRGGVRAMTEATQVAEGQILRVQEVDTDFVTRARVRGVSRDAHGIQRLNLEFLDQAAPERLCGSSAEWHPPVIELPPAVAAPEPAVSAKAAQVAAAVPAAPGRPRRPTPVIQRQPGELEQAAVAGAGDNGTAAGVGREELFETYERVKNRSHYEALGIEPGASPADVKAAYRRMARRFHPDIVGRNGVAELRKPAQSIVIRLGFAVEALTDPDSRAFYDRKLREAAEPQVDESDPGPDPEEARARGERIILEARELIGREKHWDAIQVLQASIPFTADPRQRHTMQIYLANATARNPKWLDRAEEILLGVLTEAPDNVDALHLLGVVYCHAQSDEKARQMFERVLELEPGHSQASAALQGLRAAASGRVATST
jgi:hypothetical protein